MTLAQNHLRRLNGSKYFFFILLLICLACTTSRKGSSTKSRSTDPAAGEKGDLVRVYDPATNTYILVPRESVKVDTIKWTEDKAAPILADEKETLETPVKKTRYEVCLLIPLNSQNYTDPEGQLDSRVTRFMQYYGGMRIAANEVAQKGWPVTFRSFDTETSISKLNNFLKDPAIKYADVIVGPYEKDNVEAVATFGLQNEKMVVSPWLPAFHIDQENPYFIQVLAGLNTHAEVIMDFIAERNPDKKVFLVARNQTTEIQRLGLFKKNPRIKTEDLIIDDESIELAKTNLSFLLDDPDGTVFVMPYYSRQDETFVNSFLRKLHADKGNKGVMVFGLPQWTTFNNLNPNYMESLSVHISSSTYINTGHPSYRNFRNKFFTEYFTMPDNQAYLGYDLVMWIAATLAKDGPQGLIKGTPGEFGLASGFQIKPVYPEGAKKPSEMKTPLYYENYKVRILAYRDQDFEAVY